MRKKILLICWIFVTLHTIKDFFQDFLETDFLYFVDANENLTVLPQWGKWMLALTNETATLVGIALVVTTPLSFRKVRLRLEKVLLVSYAFFLLVLGIDFFLDPRIKDPKLFFDKSTRIPASQMKNTYQNIL